MTVVLCLVSSATVKDDIDRLMETALVNNQVVFIFIISGYFL